MSPRVLFNVICLAWSMTINYGAYHHHPQSLRLAFNTPETTAPAMIHSTPHLFLITQSAEVEIAQLAPPRLAVFRLDSLTADVAPVSRHRRGVQSACFCHACAPKNERWNDQKRVLNGWFLFMWKEKKMTWITEIIEREQSTLNDWRNFLVWNEQHGYRVECTITGFNSIKDAAGEKKLWSNLVGIPPSMPSAIIGGVSIRYGWTCTPPRHTSTKLLFQNI